MKKGFAHATEGSIVFPAWSGLERGLEGAPEVSQNPQHSRVLVIDAEKNISTKPASGFHYEISTPAFLFFPKVKTDKDLGLEK